MAHLGQELLDEIYTAEGEGEATVEMGDDTRAGLEAAIPAEEATAPEEAFEVEEETETETEAEPVVAEKPRAVVKEMVVEYGPDALSTSLTALMVVALILGSSPEISILAIAARDSPIPGNSRPFLSRKSTPKA